MKNTIRSVVQGVAVTAMLLGGAAVSEASSFTLVNGSSHVDLCLPGGVGCGPLGLSNWVATGTAVTGWTQWFTGYFNNDPYWSWGEASLETLGTLSSSHAGNVANVSFYDATNHVGIDINYVLDEIAGASHIVEHFTAHNDTYSGYFSVGISDGMSVNLDDYIAHGEQAVDRHNALSLGTADYTPNPEPMTMVLLGTGLLAVARSRKKVRNSTIA